MFAFPAGANAIVPIACIIYLVLAIWMAIVTIQAVAARKGGRMVQAPVGTD